MTEENLNNHALENKTNSVVKNTKREGIEKIITKKQKLKKKL